MSPAGLTRKGGSGHHEAGWRAHRLPVGKGALLTANPLVAKSSPSFIIQEKETSDGECILPRTTLRKPRASRACGLLTEREREAWHVPGEGWPEEGDALGGGTLLHAEQCEGSAHPHLHVFFSFSLTLVLCYLKSKSDQLPPALPSLVSVRDLSCPVLLMSLSYICLKPLFLRTHP